MRYRLQWIRHVRQEVCWSSQLSRQPLRSRKRRSRAHAEKHGQAIKLRQSGSDGGVFSVVSPTNASTMQRVCEHWFLAPLFGPNCCKVYGKLASQSQRNVGGGFAYSVLCRSVYSIELDIKER